MTDDREVIDVPIFVGENNPYGDEKEYALYPLPVGSAGSRLQKLIVRIRIPAYVELPRFNLCVGGWRMKDARMKADILTSLHLQPLPTCTAHRILGVTPETAVLRGRLVLLGRRVSSAFRVPFAPATMKEGMLILGHPSGRNLWYSDPRRLNEAHDLIRFHFPRLPY